MRLIDTTLYCLLKHHVDKETIHSVFNILIELGIVSFLVSPDILNRLNEHSCSFWLKDLFENQFELLSVNKDEQLMIHYVDSQTILSDFQKDFRHCISDINHSYCLDTSRAGIFATALSYEWIREGGEYIMCSMFGMDGGAATEELLAILYAQGYSLDNVKLDKLKSSAVSISDLLKRNIPSHKAIVGESIFHVESGIHVNGLKKNASCFEPIDPSVIGADRKIRIGTHTSPSTIDQILKDSGITADYAEIAALTKEIRIAVRGGQRNWQISDIIDLYFRVIAKKQA